MKNKGGGKSGQHELPSGLIHNADSLAGGPRGQFIKRFGAPGEPEVKAGPGRTEGIVGKAGSPKYLRKK